MDVFVRNDDRGDKNQSNRKRLSKTDIGIPQDFVHVATVKSPTKREVNFNDALISEFLQRAEVSASALSDPEIQRCIKDFIQRVGLEAIHREIYQEKAGVFPQINIESHEDVHHPDEKDLPPSQIQSNDSSSIACIPDLDIDLTPEIDDVFTEPDTSIASPTTPNRQDSKQPSVTELQRSPEDTSETQSQLKSEDLKKSPNPSNSDHIRESVSEKGSTQKKKPDHDNFLRELKDAIMKRNARMKKNANDEMKKSEEGWSNWKSPKKSKSYVSFFKLDSPPAKPTRTVHTLWDLTSESHYSTETDCNDDPASDAKAIDSPDGKNLPPNKTKLPLTKRTKAITKKTSSEIEDQNSQKMKQDETNKENIQAGPTNQSASGPINMDVSQTGENDNELPEGKKDSKNELKKDKSSEKKNKASWFYRKNQNKSANKPTMEGLPAEEKSTMPGEKENENDSDINESSNNKGEEKKITSIFSSLTKKKQSKEEFPLDVGNEKMTHNEGKDQPKSKMVSSGKFRLFGSSDKLIDSEKRDKENKKEEKEKLQTAATPSSLDNNTEITNTTVNDVESSYEIISNEQKNDLADQELSMEKQTHNSEEEEKIKKEETNLTKSKAKSTSMKNLFFASGKNFKVKVDKKKQEDLPLDKNELSDTQTSESIRKDDEDVNVSKKRSGIMHLLFSPPEKHSKRKDEMDQQNSEKEEKGSKQDTELSSEFFVDIPLCENEAELQDNVEELESSMQKEEVNTAGNVDEPSKEESMSMSPKKVKIPGKINFLFSPGKQNKNKPEEKKEEAIKEKKQVAKEKASNIFGEDDSYDSWDKSKHSAFVNLLFAPPERHARKSNLKEKNQDNKGLEEITSRVEDQNVETIYKEEVEMSSDNKDSSIENSSSKPSMELKNEVKQEEKVNTMTKDEPLSVTSVEGEENIDKEEKEIAESEAESSAEINSSENVELKNEVEQDIEIKKESMPGLIQDKESNSMEENFENELECPVEIISTTNEAMAEVKKEPEFKELVPTIIITQDEECLSEEEEEIDRDQAGISSEMAPAENSIDSSDKNEQQKVPTLIQELITLITTKEEASSRVEGKEFPMDTTEFIAEITKCFDETVDEMKHEESSEEKQELKTEQEIIYDEKSQHNFPASETISTIMINVSLGSGDHSTQEMDDENNEKDVPVTAIIEEKINEGEKGNVSTKEKRLSGIIDSLFGKLEKQAKPKQDKKKRNSSKNEDLSEDSMPQIDGKIDKEGFACKVESTENVVELTREEKPSEISEKKDVPVTPTYKENNNEGRKENVSTKEKRLSGIIDSLFGKPEKQAKPKQDKKKYNSSKNEDLSGDNMPQIDGSDDIKGSANNMESTENVVELTNVEKSPETFEEKDEPITSLCEEKNNGEGTKNVSKKEMRPSSIIDSLFGRQEKQAKPKQDKKNRHSSRNEELSEETIPQIDGSMDQEGSVNKVESTENIVELTSDEKPPKVSENQPRVDSSNDEELNPATEMNASLGRGSSNRMQALFGSTGKYSKPKKTLKQEKISKKGELSSKTDAVDDDLKSEEGINSSLDKAKSSSMRKLLFGKLSKPKHEEAKDLPTSKTLDDEVNGDEDGKNPTAKDEGSLTEISQATSDKPNETELETTKQDKLIEELSIKTAAGNEDLKGEEETNSSLDKAKTSSMRNLLFGKRSKPKHEETKDLKTPRAFDDEENKDEDGNNPTAEDEESSIGISQVTSDKPSEKKHKIKKQDKYAKGELPGTTISANEGLKSEEEINSSLDKAKSSSMKKLLFGKLSKPKQEESKDLPTSKTLHDEGNRKEDGKTPSAEDEGSSIEISQATSDKPNETNQEMEKNDEQAKDELSITTAAANEDVKCEEENNSTLDKTKSSSMRKLLFGKRPKPKQEETKDLTTPKALNDEENIDKDDKNPIAKDNAPSIEISPATYDKPKETKQEMKKNDELAIMVELQQETGESNKPVQEKEDGRTSRTRIPASRKTGFFSLPDRKGRMRNEIKNHEDTMSKEEPQSALKETKVVEKRPSRSNSSIPRKKGLLSSLDKRKKYRHEARRPEVSLVKDSLPIKPGDVEIINNDRDRPSFSGTETSTTATVVFPNERPVDVGEISDDSYKLKAGSKEDLLKSSSYPRRRRPKVRRELKKEDISLQKDMRHTTHVTWDPIKKNFVLHYTDNEGLRKILVEENYCKEAPAPRQRRHSYSMAMDDTDTEIFEEIPRVSVSSFSSEVSNRKSSGRNRKRVPIARPRSEIVRGNQPSTEL